MAGFFNIGELDTMVTIQSVAQSRGDQGQNVEVFTDIAHVFAKVDRSVSESVNDGNLESGRDIALTIYKIAGMSTRWRVLVGGVPYGIVSIDDIDRLSPICVLSIKSIEG